MIKYFNLIKVFFIIFITSLFFLSGCSEKKNSLEQLRDSLTFYASFDNGFTADFANGDSELYIAPSWDRRSDLTVYTGQEDYLLMNEGVGVHGNAIWFNSQSEPIFFFKGLKNISYDRQDWNGTVSFWMRLNPEEDLRDGYSDPIQITSRSWNDGAMFVDFTEKEPRIFRFAIFPDREVWDPQERDWGEVPVDERPMLDVPELPFSREEWTHVAFTFVNFNTGREDGRVMCYINGEKIGVMDESEKTFTWDPENVAIWLGYNYVGYLDELSIFNRDLNEEEILRVYTLENGIRQIIEI